jgi:hypothetical protein
MSGENRRTSRKVGAESDAGRRQGRCRAQHLQESHRRQIADERCIGRRRRRGGAAQVAMFAGVSRQQVGLAPHFIAGDRSRRSTVTDDREGIDGCPVGRDRHSAKHNNMQGDRIDRHPTRHLPGQTAYATRRPCSGSLLPRQITPNRAAYSVSGIIPLRPLSFSGRSAFTKGSVRPRFRAARNAPVPFLPADFT